MAERSATARPPRALRRALVPLALAQFICSFAGSNMNVMINDISRDLDTTVQGVQIAITVFLLVMAARSYVYKLFVNVLVFSYACPAPPSPRDP